MNKRQKKKIEDKLIFRIRKLHPKKDDIVLIEVDFECCDIDVAVEYFKTLCVTFPKTQFTMIPDPITLKSMYKEDVYKYLNKIKEMVDNV